MPKIKIDYETLDDLTRAGLENLLECVVEGYKQAQYQDDKTQYREDIAAIQHVLEMYR